MLSERLPNMPGEPGSLLAYTPAQRQKIMACIQRSNNRESTALHTIPWTRPDVRAKVRAWYYAYRSYLIGEYEKVVTVTVTRR